jgi:hypothetical protein
MRGRTTGVVAALAVLDLVVVVLGYRAQGGSLPPLQRTTASFEVSETPTADATGGPDDQEISAPLLLGVNPSGVVLRATRGACEDFRDNPAHVWAGNLDAAEAPALVDTRVQEVLGLMVYGDGSMRITGLDGDCRPVTVDSKDGQTWQSSDETAIWRLDGDTTASNVVGPAGLNNDTPCTPVQLLNLPRKRALGSCASGTFFPLAPGEQVRGIPAGGFGSLSVAPGPDDGQYFVFGTTGDCTAGLGLLDTADQSVANLPCLGENQAPLAIATTADMVVVQVGNDLMVSDDGGESFATVGG